MSVSLSITKRTGVCRRLLSHAIWVASVARDYTHPSIDYQKEFMAIARSLAEDV